MDEERTQTSGTAPPAGILDSLLSDPELLGKISGIVAAMQKNTTAESSSPTTSPPEKEPVAGSVPVGTPGEKVPDGLADLLSDPAMLEKLPQMIAVIKPLLSGITVQPKASPAALPLRSQPECRDNLLLALKPFLSPERREAVDSIIRISKLGLILRQLK